MPESPNQATSRQRRANWVGLRTLRQVPRVVGEMAGGEPIYEVRSVRLMLDGSGGHFVRVTSCSRCGREVPGTPVLTPLDLDRAVRSVICNDCSQAGVSTVRDSEGAEPGRPGPAAEAPAPAIVEEPAPPQAGPALVDKEVERLDVMERHLRAVTDRVNELGRVARGQRDEGKPRAEHEGAATAALEGELAAVRVALEESWRQQAGREEAAASALREELASVRAALEEARLRANEGRHVIEAAIGEWRAERAAGAAAGAAGQVDLAVLARQLEAQSAELVQVTTAVGESRTVVEAATGATRELARAHDALDRRLTEAVARFGALQVDASSVHEALTTRLSEAEGRLSHQIAGQRADLETAVESQAAASVAGLVSAQEQLAGGQAVLEARLTTVAGQLAQVSGRLDSLVERLANEPPAPAQPAPAPQPAGGFLDALDRQLDAAARRLAARSAGSDER